MKPDVSEFLAELPADVKPIKGLCCVVRSERVSEGSAVFLDVNKEFLGLKPLAEASSAPRGTAFMILHPDDFLIMKDWMSRSEQPLWGGGSQRKH